MKYWLQRPLRSQFGIKTTIVARRTMPNDFFNEMSRTLHIEGRVKLLLHLRAAVVAADSGTMWIVMETSDGVDDLQ
jgi:hypothetical protein